jgi:hypothetical protein
MNNEQVNFTYERTWYAQFSKALTTVCYLRNVVIIYTIPFTYVREVIKVENFKQR